MARVRPFAGWRFATPTTDISDVVAPPYDVISAEQRDELCSRSRHNTVNLELPSGPLDPTTPGSRYETGHITWEQWKADGVVVQDGAPAIYVLEQTFTLAERPVRRRAFIVEVGLEPFDAGVILPHERTLPKALGDRFELIKATAANFSQVFGLFDDPECRTDRIFDQVMAGDPVAVASDDDGVVSRLWMTTAESIASALVELLAPGQIFIADGHHRYTTALAYRDLRREQDQSSANTVLDPAYDYVMMALVNMDDPDLVVLPTHRVADAPSSFDPVAFEEDLARTFLIEHLKGHPAGVLEAIEEPAFLVKTRGARRPFLARLRPDVDLETAIDLDRSPAWKSLDVAVLQELVLDPLLQIHPDRPETLDRLAFVKNAHDALAMTSEHDVAFVLRATRMDQLRSVALAAETMPQKSTYFYPKLLSGLVFRSAQ